MSSTSNIEQAQITSEVKYNCIECGHRILKGGEMLSCPSCRTKWKLINGIPNFSNKELYWNHVSKAIMEEIILVAREKGYKSALESILLKETNQYVYNLAIDEKRADFSVLLDLDSKSRVLDIGSNWGAISVSLAKRCGELYAVDTAMESLAFLKIRAEQELLDNIKLCKVDPLDYGKLPFPDSLFDAVLLNGVLEWIGNADTDKPVDVVRKKALGEIKRVLKPNGSLYIGMENRYSILYFMGSIDHHGLPFTSILPRFLSDRIMRLLKKRRYRTFTYSFKGQEDFLEYCGFRKRHIYMPLPTYHNPLYLVPLDMPQPLKYFFSSRMVKNDPESLKRRALLWLVKSKYLFLYRMLAPSFAVVANPIK